MPNPKFIPLLKTGYSSEVPVFTNNTGDETVDVSKYEKIKIQVPTGSPGNVVTLDEFVEMREGGTLQDDTIYSIVI